MVLHPKPILNTNKEKKTFDVIDCFVIVNKLNIKALRYGDLYTHK